MRNIDDITLQQQFDREDRADAYRARRDAQTPEEREEEQYKQRVVSRAFQARKSPEERALDTKKRTTAQRARRASETPEEHDIRRAKHREYLRAWRARKKRERAEKK